VVLQDLDRMAGHLAHDRQRFAGLYDDNVTGERFELGDRGCESVYDFDGGPALSRGGATAVATAGAAQQA
jgi:hypothetical protein